MNGKTLFILILIAIVVIFLARIDEQQKRVLAWGASKNDEDTRRGFGKVKLYTSKYFSQPVEFLRGNRVRVNGKNGVAYGTFTINDKGAPVYNEGFNKQHGDK